MNRDEINTVKDARYAEQNGTHFSDQDQHRLLELINKLEVTYLTLSKHS